MPINVRFVGEKKGEHYYEVLYPTGLTKKAVLTPINQDETSNHYALNLEGESLPARISTKRDNGKELIDLVETAVNLFETIEKPEEGFTPAEIYRKTS